MNRRIHGLLLLAVAAFGLGVAPSRGLAQARPARKPNIVILLADDLGFADLGFQGCKDIPTPRIDALARGGVRFTNGYVSGPYCSPTRAGLLTGRYQTRFGHEFNPGERENGVPIGLPITETTIADRLKSAGYATGLVGKWHLGGAPRFHPQKRGFDEFFGFLGGAHPYFAGQGVPILRGTEPVHESEYLTDAFGREAVSFIQKHKDHPFFLYLAFNAVHTPMHADDRRLKLFPDIKDKQRRTYAAMLTAMDEAVGKVLDTIRASGLEEDTLIFFFSDNGGPTMPGTTVNASSNAPLRGSKRTTLEGGIHVPFVLNWKGKPWSGSTYDQPIIQLDILPTALAAAGVDVKAGAKLDGVNLLPYLEGKEKRPPHDVLYWRFGAQSAIRRGDWKLVRHDLTVDGDAGEAGPRNRAGIAVSAPRLYNLANDLGETKDLSAQNPEKARELQELWNRWNATLVPPLWGSGGLQGK
jgi:arylsulfatase A-like enzyme